MAISRPVVDSDGHRCSTPTAVAMSMGRSATWAVTATNDRAPAATAQTAVVGAMTSPRAHAVRLTRVDHAGQHRAQARGEHSRIGQFNPAQVIDDNHGRQRWRCGDVSPPVTRTEMRTALITVRAMPALSPPVACPAAQHPLTTTSSTPGSWCWPRFAPRPRRSTAALAESATSSGRASVVL